LATILHFKTIPTWAVNVSQENLYGSVSLSIGALFFSWMILVTVVFFLSSHKEFIANLIRDIRYDAR
jgi:hypothetical protein